MPHRGSATRAARTSRPAQRPTRTRTAPPRDDQQAERPEPPHGHAHSHEPPPPASARLRTLLGTLLAPFILATLVGLVLLWPSGDLPSSTIDSGDPVDATVTAVASGSCTEPGEITVDDSPDDGADGKKCLTVTLRLTDGPAAGETLHKIVPIQPAMPRFTAGDDVVLAYTGGDPTSPDAYQIKDFQRATPLLLLAAVFVLAVLALGRWKGLRALAGLSFTFGALAVFVLPAILDGRDPLLVAITGAGLIMFATLYLTHGISARTTVAVLGTLISLALIGLFAALFSWLAVLTGLDEPTAALISALGHGIDARGLLLAGVVIGALGVLDDITITQASAVWELKQANAGLGWARLYRSALRIGRDHVASAVNTLVLAYAGAALPVMLYTAISGVGLGTILTSQDIAQEILRTLAGSLGIIAAVPVTTALAALVVHRERLAGSAETDDEQAAEPHTQRSGSSAARTDQPGRHPGPAPAERPQRFRPAEPTASHATQPEPGAPGAKRPAPDRQARQARAGRPGQVSRAKRRTD
ncbi:YibE/F family protein [Thermocrispum sp.]|uniref:YibE/F family protein n=1 Tax=Thermocrispum sp. TaxID=2060768 RepID=UPI00257FFAE1|nr:YibE/F family protein [Thermocrispum sp.]